MQNTIIRKIQPSNNPHLALIIRNALAEFGANKPGTVFMMIQLIIYTNFPGAGKHVLYPPTGLRYYHTNQKISSNYTIADMRLTATGRD